MKALFTDAPGGWENTKIIDMPDPMAREGEVLVDIKSVGLNPADYFQVQGQYPGQPKAPFVTGRDGAGVIAVGSGTKELPAGTPVLIIQSQLRNLAEGTLCERQRFPVSVLAPIPDGWSMEEAAAAPLAYMTAWRALTVAAKCREETKVLVTGASGGVGTAAVQLALGMGATVVALSRSLQKRAKLTALGAQHVFDSDDPDLKRRFQKPSRTRRRHRRRDRRWAVHSDGRESSGTLRNRRHCRSPCRSRRPAPHPVPHVQASQSRRCSRKRLHTRGSARSVVQDCRDASETLIPAHHRQGVSLHRVSRCRRTPEILSIW